MSEQRTGGRERDRHQQRQRLGYLLKHGYLRLGEMIDSALETLGIDARDWAVLLRLDPSGQGAGEPVSQQELAGRLGIDRTTMVAMVDALEAKGLVERHPHPADRRKNVVTLTAAGADTLTEATQAGAAAEREFLSPLSGHDARLLEDALRRVLHLP